ncbi:MAG TPA: SDR family oxidoreductase, partial [candidate division Zixibacteria bacterium]|nr:SDR family oxidoreductase [candidate division Zixibacteria bacterium]
TKSVALYCAEEKMNIRVNSIHPAYIWTPMVQRLFELQGDVSRSRQAADRAHPIGHMGEPIDVANAALYLAADEAKFVTGTELIVDGGYTAR